MYFLLSILFIANVLSQTPPNCDSGSVGGGWKLVRRVAPGVAAGAANNPWHQSTDNIAGTDVYGAPTGTDATDAVGTTSFSIDFETAVAGYNELLFATGNCQTFAVFTKDNITALATNAGQVTIDMIRFQGSPCSGPTPVNAVGSSGNSPRFPAICSGANCGFNDAAADLYFENSYGDQSGVIFGNNGMNIWVRVGGTSFTCNPSVTPSMTPSAAPTVSTTIPSMQPTTFTTMPTMIPTSVTTNPSKAPTESKSNKFSIIVCVLIGLMINILLY